MYTLTLSHEEQQALVDLLECSTRELHSEIIRTDNHCFKKALKDRKQMLVNLLENLKRYPSAA